MMTWTLAKLSEDTSPYLNIEFAFTLRNANTIIKIFILRGKWEHKTNVGMFLIYNKIVATALLASLTALWLSQHTV